MAEPDTLQPPPKRPNLVIPPDPDAVREALRPPPRRTRYAPLVATACIAIGLSWLALPSTKTSPSSRPGLAEAILWGRSLRVEAPLLTEAGRPRQRLCGWLVFTFRPTRGDLDGARTAIRDRQSDAIRAVEAWLATRRPIEIYARDGLLEIALADILTQQLFRGGEGRVHRVSWESIQLRSTP